MKYLDKVKVIRDREEYTEYGIHKGMVGTIILAEIRDNCFDVIFIDPNMEKDDIDIPISINDLELVEDREMQDSAILGDLPKNNPSWWCIVENGYIMNLKGERKNKIPYDYNS